MGPPPFFWRPSFGGSCKKKKKGTLLPHCSANLETKPAVDIEKWGHAKGLAKGPTVWMSTTAFPTAFPYVGPKNSMGPLYEFAPGSVAEGQIGSGNEAGSEAS